MTDKQSCGRRMLDFGPQLKFRNQDEWRDAGRWKIDFKWPEDKPRWCSFCGSIHPDDAIALLKHGWEIDRAKSYKFYINPPGTRDRTNRILEKRRAGDRDGEGLRIPNTGPPVKLYVQHMGPGHVEEWNDLIGQGLK